MMYLYIAIDIYIYISIPFTSRSHGRPYDVARHFSPADSLTAGISVNSETPFSLFSSSFSRITRITLISRLVPFKSLLSRGTGGGGCSREKCLDGTPRYIPWDIYRRRDGAHRALSLACCRLIEHTFAITPRA